MIHHRARQHGFTLLEILVAFVMLALVGGALLQLFQGGLRNMTHSDDYARAALMAESTLSRLRAEADLEPGRQSGEPARGFRYEVILSPYLDQGEPVPDLLQADLTIQWGGGEQPRRYQVRSLLLPRGSR